MTPAHAGEFGTRCQKTFQNGWQTEISYAWERCGGFNDELNDTDAHDFYWDLNGALWSFYDFWFKWLGPLTHYGDDHLPGLAGNDTVDLLYVSTHGGICCSGNSAILAGGLQNQIIYSGFFRFGDDDDQLRIYSQYACDTLRIDDKAAARWIWAFRGGVQLVTGSHDTIHDGYYLDDTGEDYADELQDGTSVKWSWFDGLWDAYTDQDVAVYASGVNEGDCMARLSFMTWQNLSSFVRLRNNDVARICASWITDY